MSYDHECCQHYRCGDDCESELDTTTCRNFFDNGRKDPEVVCKLPTTVSAPAEVAATTTPSVEPVDEPSPGL